MFTTPGKSGFYTVETVVPVRGRQRESESDSDVKSIVRRIETVPGPRKCQLQVLRHFESVWQCVCFHPSPSFATHQSGPRDQRSSTGSGPWPLLPNFLQQNSVFSKAEREQSALFFGESKIKSSWGAVSLVSMTVLGSF